MAADQDTDLTPKAAEFKKREKAVLDCALELFLEHGESKVTVEMIADKAGIGKGTVYKHFTTKSEIYALLMIQYESEMSDMFQRIGHEDPAVLAREYFNFRLGNPEKYALFDRLESLCKSEGKVDEMVREMHRIRRENMERLINVISRRIAEGKLVDVPPTYHLGAAWAFVHGVVALYQSDFYKSMIDDEEPFFNYLMEVLLRLGNKDKLDSGSGKEDAIVNL